MSGKSLILHIQYVMKDLIFEMIPKWSNSQFQTRQIRALHKPYNQASSSCSQHSWRSAHCQRYSHSQGHPPLLPEHLEKEFLNSAS